MRNQPTPLQHLNRTFIGSVLFIDIVGYSRRTVPDQLEIKEVFNQLLTAAVQNVAPAERIMVDTGDGAAVAFLGDPEDALFAALSLRDAIDAGKVTVGDPGFVRMGINLGPLKMVRDINGHTNMIGDGVNDAQRVMSFSEPGQVMVSHSYFDIISRFSRDYTKLFVYEGTRHDKHVREHEVYRFGPADGAEPLAEKLTEKMRDRSRARTDGIDGASFDPGEPEVQRGLAARQAAEAGAPARPASRNALIAVAIGAVALAGAFWSWTGKSSATQADAAALSAQALPASAAPPAAGAAATGSASTQAAAAPTQGKETDKSGETTAEQAAEKRPAVRQAQQSLQESRDKPAVRADKRGEEAVPPGTVKLAVQPWGEIYVDGARRGVTPPLKSLSLAPGRHRIEIRNGQFAPHRQTVEVRSNSETTIQHLF